MGGHRLRETQHFSAVATGALRVAGDPQAWKRLRKIFSRHQMLAQAEATIIRRARQRYASFARIITFDRRGTGLSDPVDRPPTLDRQMDDLDAVLDAVGVERVALIALRASHRRSLDRRRARRQPGHPASKTRQPKTVLIP